MCAMRARKNSVHNARQWVSESRAMLCLSRRREFGEGDSFAQAGSREVEHKIQWAVPLSHGDE